MSPNTLSSSPVNVVIVLPVIIASKKTRVSCMLTIDDDAAPAKRGFAMALYHPDAFSKASLAA